jgi:glucose-6-phosphate 1-epimerase
MSSDSFLDALNERFAIPGIARIVAGNGGLPKIEITAAKASAEIYLHGAQVTAWRPAGSEEVIFVSGQSHWQDGKAIRGGIPVCFPWFRAKADDAKAPSHGFVRTKAWELWSIEQDGDSIVAVLETTSNDATRRWWPHDFRLVHRITVGTELKLELLMENTGSTPLKFEEALHTYHRVGDVRKIRVAGLDGVTYLDNMDGNHEKMQAGDVRFSRAMDNAYLNTASAAELIDPTLRRRIKTEKKNSLTTVVWNPWQEGAKALADLGDEEWTSMACVEASNILANAVSLDAGAEHTMTATITVTEDKQA